jgi:DnaK suppressor protein
VTGNIQTRKALAEHLTELEARAEHLMADLTEAMSADFEEQAIEAEDDEMLLAQETLVAHKITAILAAIKRVDEGTYGICTTCGGKIASARLEAMPEAIQCISCVNDGQGQTPCISEQVYMSGVISNQVTTLL